MEPTRASDEGERRLVAEVVLDVADGDARTVQLGGEGVGDARGRPVLSGGRALSAVEDTVRVERPGRRSFRKRLHCASPWGCDATRVTSLRVASGWTTRQ